MAIKTDHLQGFGLGYPPRLPTPAEASRQPTPANASRSNDCTQSESGLDSRRESTVTDEGLTNPLASGKSVYIADRTGQPCESACEQMLH